MIQLFPNRCYKLTYTGGTNTYFKTLDEIPEAKHLIVVKNLATDTFVDLVGLLSHSWASIVEIEEVELPPPIIEAYLQ